MRIGMALVACLAALGCRGGAPAKECSAAADELTRWLGTLNLEPQPFMIGKLRLVRRADLPARRISTAPVMDIGADETTYQGQIIAAREHLHDLLAETRRKILDDLDRGRYGDEAIEPRELHLLIDESAPWDRVVLTIEVAHRAGFTMPSFVFTPPPQPSNRPPRSWFDDRMDALDAAIAEGRTVEAPGPSRPIVERCSSVIRMFDDLGAMESGDKVARLVRSIGPALVACSCEVDLPALRSQLWHMLHNQEPVRELAVEVSPDAPAVALPASTPWREASKRLSPATARVWLTVAD